MRNLRVCEAFCAKVDVPSNSSSYHLSVDSLTSAIFIGCSKHIVFFDFASDSRHVVDVSGECVGEGDGVVVLEFLSDQQLVFIALRGGGLLIFDPFSKSLECGGQVVGGVDGGGWSPDMELVVLISPDGLIYLINRELDVIAQFDSDPSELGQDQLVSVGWGKKETQFHGSAGKQAALTHTEETSSVSDSDEGRVLVSWRGDGQYFAVSSISKQSKIRVIRTWSREGVLCSTCESLQGIEPSLAWKPSGGILACSAQRKEEVEVAFFERNGLRHGGFSLRVPAQQGKVKKLAWNTDSTILAVWVESLDSKWSRLELWCVGNYHWYLKQSLQHESQLRCFLWDTERSHTLHLLWGEGEYQKLTLDYFVDCTNSTLAPVAVIDGEELKLSFFAKAPVPPPLCAVSLKTPASVNSVFWSKSGCALAAYLADRSLILWNINVKATLKTVFKLPEVKGYLWHWIWVVENETLALCSCSPDYSYSVLLFSIENLDSESSVLKLKSTLTLQQSPCALVVDNRNRVFVQYSDGSWSGLDFETEGSPYSDTDTPVIYPKFRAACSDCAVIFSEETKNNVFVGLSRMHQLFVDNREVATNITSLALHHQFLLLTTFTHQLYCIPLEQLTSPVTKRKEGCLDFDVKAFPSRSVERGSKLVCGVWEGTQVVLQMPRGNIETVFPRSLTLYKLFHLLQKKKYKDSLLLMKQQRINMNLLYDHDPKNFLLNVKDVIEDVGDANLLNLFIMELGAEDVRKTLYSDQYPLVEHTCNGIEGKKDSVCLALRSALVSKEEWKAKYFTVILSTYAKLTQPQIDKALLFLKELKTSSEDPSSVVDESLRHLLYLIDPEELYRMALSTYDFDLVLIVAERSQKDPKEYLTFLNDLRKEDENYMKFKIEHFLKRNHAALEFLVKCGDSRFEECISFIKQHHLYQESLKYYPPNTKGYTIVSSLYASRYLVPKGCLVEAALFYRKAGELQSAFDAYSRASEWREAIQMAKDMDLPKSDFETVIFKLATQLHEKRHFSDAALIFRLYLKNEVEAVKSYCSGDEWVNALEVCGFEMGGDVVKNTLIPSLRKQLAGVSVSVTTMQADLEKYSHRLQVLRNDKKLLWQKRFNDDGDFPDAEVYSEATTTVSQSTLASTASGIRKEKERRVEKKKRTLREGSRYEDMGIMYAIKDAILNCDQMQEQVKEIVYVAVRLSLKEEAKELTHKFQSFYESCEKILHLVWSDRWPPSNFPGPLDEVFSQSTSGADEGDVDPVFGPDTSIRLEPCVYKPTLRNNVPWKLHFLSD